MLNPPGIEKYIIKVINQLNNIGRQKLPYFCFIMSNKNYAVGHAFTSHDLFFNFPVNKLNMTTQQCKEVYSDGNKRDLASQIFTRSVQLVIEDIIDNNTHFKFPGIGKTQAYMYMKRTYGDKFKKAFKNGKWRDIDFFLSNFSGYQIVLEMLNQEKLPRTKNVYLSAKDKQKIVDNTNNGKQY